MAKILLHQNTFFLELTEKYEGIEQDEIERLANCLEKDVECNGSVFEWVSSVSGIFDTEKDNIGKCANCGALTTDCDKSNPVKGIHYGAKLNGTLLCDLCLPKNHPRAF
jgi:hypothetical protein